MVPANLLVLSQLGGGGRTFRRFLLKTLPSVGRTIAPCRPGGPGSPRCSLTGTLSC